MIWAAARHEAPHAGRDAHREVSTHGYPERQTTGQVTRHTSAARAGRVVATAPIVLYQRVISPALPRRCKYEPTCSRYAIRAVGEYGILRGLVLATWRLLRCNPWSHGGYDPVEAQRLFRMGRRGQ